MDCKICGRTTNISLHLSSTVYYCADCKYYFAPKVEFNKDFVSDLNEEVRTDALKDLRVSNYNIILNQIEKISPNKLKGLEIGSAYGWFLEMAHERGIDCVGIEPEERMYQITKDKGFMMQQGFFPSDLPDEWNNFDFIIFNDVFEHIPDFNEVLEKCYSILSNDGLIIINLPVHTGLFYKIAKITYYLKMKSFLERMWQFNFHSPHFHYFDKNSLEKVMNNHGLKICEYHPLDTLNKEGTKQRINMDKNMSKFSSILAPAINILVGFEKLLPDIGCFYAKKINEGIAPTD